MLLNLLDLSVCVSTFFVQMTWYFMLTGVIGDPIPINLSLSLYKVSTLGTGIMTCILSVTRAISLCAPFYHPKFKAIITFLVTFMAVVLLGNVTCMVLAMIQNSKPGGSDRTVPSSIVELKAETIALLSILVVVGVSNVGTMGMMLATW